MLRSDAEHHLHVWLDETEKIYRYSREFFPSEFVVYRKYTSIGDFTSPGITTYKFIEAKSTYELKDLTPDEFVKKLANEELVYEKDYGWSTDTLKMKTGGCTCGAWILKDNAGMHDEKCPLHKFPKWIG